MTPRVGRATALLATAVIGISCGGPVDSGDPRDAAPFLEGEEAYRANNRGVALLEQFDYASAAEAFREALAIDETLGIARANLGLALFLDQDLDGAGEAARAAVTALPGQLEPQYLAGLVARASNQTEDALAAFSAVLEADPTDVGANVNLGQIALEARDYARAAELLRVAYAREPFNVTAAYTLGLALVRSGSQEEGRELLETAQALRGSGYAMTYGTGYLQQGRYAEALSSTGAEAALVDATPSAAALTQETLIARATAGSGPSPFGRTFGPEALDEAGGRTLAGALGGGLTPFDSDGDGDLDLFLAAAGDERLLRNDGPDGFVDVTTEVGLGAPEDGVAVGAVSADVDNDLVPDLFVLRLGRSSLYRNDGERFTDVTDEAGLPRLDFLPGAAALSDVDHDGDVDLVVAGLADLEATRALADRSGPRTFPDEFAPAPLALFRNNLDGTFTDVTVDAGLGVTGHTVALVPTDIDNRRDVDLLVVDHGRAPRLFQNQRDSTFVDVAERLGLTALTGPTRAAATADLDKDDFPDVVFGRDTGVVAAMSDGRGGLTVETLLGDVEDLRAIALLDHDLDGLVDVLVTTGTGPRLLRNVGGDDWDEVTTAGAAGWDAATAPRSAHGLVVADLDADGDSDVLGGGPDAVWLARNSGDPAHGSVSIALQGLVSNRSGVGAKVQLRAGSLRSRLETSAASPPVAPADLVFGYGRREGADVVRIVWPSGILQAEVAPTPDAPEGQTPEPAVLDTRLPVRELDREPSSCPFLFTWNGTEFEFVTDFLGGGEMGLWHGPDLYNRPDPVEYVRIRGDQLRPRDGRLELRITNELEETIFLDEVELLALDHPADLSVFPNEGLTDPPKPHRLHAVARTWPVRAREDDGHDASARVATLDRRYAEGFPLESIRGFARPHAITLDLDATQVAATGDRGTVLLLTGWTSYSFSSDNVAAHQTGLRMAPPGLEIQAADGTWRSSDLAVGFPVGRPQTIALDLSDELRPGEHVVRLVTNMRVYWDQILAGERAPADTIRQTTLRPDDATLSVRGFSAERHPGGTQPTTYDYTTVSRRSPWKTMTGAFTRPGDVRALLDATDDQFVISKDGDQLALTFDARRLPPLAEGWSRTYLLRADGFSKEMDINSARPDAVTPLPFHAMPGYPYEAGAHYPDTEDHRSYRETYNTRVVSRSVPRIESSRPETR